MIAAPAQPVADRSTPRNAARPLPRVLYAAALDGSQKFGSLEEQVFVLARAFRDEGSLLLPLFVEPAGPARVHEFVAEGLPTASLTLWGFRWRTLWQLNRLIGSHGIQLVHWHFYPPLGNAYLWWLSVLRPRLRHFFTDHNSRLLPLPRPPSGFHRWAKRLLLKRYRRVWCVSRYVFDCLAAQRSWSHLECCLHFINTDRFRPDAEARQRVRRELGCEQAFVALAVANLIADKGIDVLLRAAALAPADVRVWVVGTGSEAGALEALGNELGLGGRVRFLGQQAHVQPYMQAADCLVCPSRWAEAAGLVNLEALSSGLPVLASRIGGIPEYVDDGGTGYLFPPGDHQALAELLSRLHANSDLRHRLGAAARTTSVRRFSVAARIQEYLDLYRA
jgi:glycosyltransferase involved in cell wall biosynthesis